MQGSIDTCNLKKHISVQSLPLAAEAAENSHRTEQRLCDSISGPQLQAQARALSTTAITAAEACFVLHNCMRCHPVTRAEMRLHQILLTLHVYQEQCLPWDTTDTACVSGMVFASSLTTLHVCGLQTLPSGARGPAQNPCCAMPVAHASCVPALLAR